MRSGEIKRCAFVSWIETQSTSVQALVFANFDRFTAPIHSERPNCAWNKYCHSFLMSPPHSKLISIQKGVKANGNIRSRLAIFTKRNHSQITNAPNVKRQSVKYQTIRTHAMPVFFWLTGI